MAFADWYTAMRRWNWWLPFKGVGMLSPESVSTEDSVSRREFLYAGGMGALGLSLGDVSATARTSAVQRRQAILILMNGGPSQLDTFDPKPEAPSQIRGPSRAAQSSVPGLWLADSLPRLAERAHQVAFVRSLHHDYAPIHETGQQLLQCGRVMEQGLRFPHFGSVIARSTTRPSAAPANVVLPRRLQATGTHKERGQSAGVWGSNWDPAEVSLSSLQTEPEAVRRAYGQHPFGKQLLQARQQLECGSRCVTVNLFDTLEDRLSWDCHGEPGCGPGTVYDYRDTLCPQFDQAFTALLDDLHQRGRANDTLVIATGEFGRTPRINDRGGRDHWTNCWSAVIAGGGVTGGAVIGASDSQGAEPIDRPVSPSELTATLLAWFGVDGRAVEITHGQKSLPLLTSAPLTELWG